VLEVLHARTKDDWLARLILYVLIVVLAVALTHIVDLLV